MAMVKLALKLSTNNNLEDGASLVRLKHNLTGIGWEKISPSCTTWVLASLF